MSIMTRKGAIQNALARLGLQAGPTQVVTALAEIGIAVSEELVHRVKLEMLKEAARVERQTMPVPHLQRPWVRHRKVPPRRGNR
jgi:hypothetical protein